MMRCKHCGGKPALIVNRYLIIARCSECGQKVVHKKNKFEDFMKSYKRLKRDWNITQFLPMPSLTKYF